MDDRPKIQLDYSSPAEERDREKRQEDERHKGLEDYSESTYGERRPIANLFLRFAAFLLVGIVIVIFIPRGIARPLLFGETLLFGIWEWARRNNS